MLRVNDGDTIVYVVFLMQSRTERPNPNQFYDFRKWFPLSFFRPHKLSRNSFMQQRSLTRLMGSEDGLHLFLGSVELDKKGLDACDKALLFSNRCKRKTSIQDLFCCYTR